MENFRATLGKQRKDVSTMFDGVAQRYDLVNTLLTLGLDRLWRARCVQAVAPRRTERILDLAAGTGVSSVAYQRHGAQVYPTDVSLGMLGTGRRHRPELNFTAGDALNLPFDDSCFDAVTISFGLRNVEHTLDALTEMRRVTKPGGKVVINEFSTPTNPGFRWLYQQVALRGLPWLAQVSSNPAAYRYLVESIMAWPNQPALADLMVEAGWRDVAWRNLTGGIVALHRGRR